MTGCVKKKDKVYLPLWLQRFYFEVINIEWAVSIPTQGFHWLDPFSLKYLMLSEPCQIKRQGFSSVMHLWLQLFLIWSLNIEWAVSNTNTRFFFRHWLNSFSLKYLISSGLCLLFHHQMMNTPSHVLPPVTSLCSAFLKSLLISKLPAR